MGADEVTVDSQRFLAHEGVSEVRCPMRASSSRHIAVKRGSRHVAFKDDSENLMKPPCETKVFNTGDAPSAINDEEEEEEILLKPSATAWRPRRLRTLV